MARILLLAAAFAAAPFAAQAATPAPVGLNDFAACAVGRNTAVAGELLGTVPGSDAEGRLVAQLASTCGGAGDPALLRGAVAERLFERDFGRIGVQPRRDSVAVFSPIPEAELATLPERGREALDRLEFAACVVAAQPERSVDLIKSRPGTAQEDRVLAALHPALGPCLQRGRSIGLNKQELRGLVAEAAYRAAFRQTPRRNTR